MFYSSEHEVIDLVQAFYKRSLPLSKWDRTAQLTVALYFGIKFPFAVARRIMHERIADAGSVTCGTAAVQLMDSVDNWLHAVRKFAIDYQNIDDIAALANIFIAMNWKNNSSSIFFDHDNFFNGDTVRNM